MDTMATYRKKRQFPRVSLPCHLRYISFPSTAAEYRHAVVRDISPVGVSIRTSESFRRRSCFLFDVTLPGADPIRSLATVVWIKAMPGDDGYQVGGKFVEPSPELAAALASIAP